MAQDGMIARALDSIHYFTQPENQDRCIIVRYNDLVEDPVRELGRIHEFIGIPPFEYRFKNFDQFSVAGVEYNDTVLEHRLHTIRTNRIVREDNQYRAQVPQRLIDKYGHIVF
jgi:hypothetical protein